MKDKDMELLKELVLDLGWDCQRMSSSGIETYNEICNLLNLEPYQEEYFTKDESQGKVYDPPMSQTEEYLLKQQREEEYRSNDY